MRRARLGVRRVHWRAVVDFYGGKCLACGSLENLTRDHVIPKSRGGENNIFNLAPLCYDCNHRKDDRIVDYRPVDWKPRLVSYLNEIGRSRAVETLLSVQGNPRP